MCILIAGDLLALAAVVTIGFVSHGEGNFSFLPRALATLLPLCGAWFLLAGIMKLFAPAPPSRIRYLATVGIAAILAAIPAAMGRSWLLGTALQPPFMVVLALTSAVALLIWRGLHAVARPR